MTTAAPEALPAYRRNIPRFYLFSVLAEFQLLMPIWVVYLQEERGLSLTQITAMEVPFWLAWVLLEVPTGVVADRFGRKTSISLGAACSSVAMVIFGMATTFEVLMLSYVLWAAAMSLYSGADAAFMYDNLKALGREEDFQKVFGRVRAVQAGSLTAAVLVGAPLAQYTTLWFPIVATGAVVALAFLVTLTFREPPQYDEDGQRPGMVENARTAVRIAWRNPAIRYMLVVGAAIMATAVGFSILAQPFLRSHHVEVGMFGWLLLPADIAGIVAALIAYRVCAAIGTRAVMTILPMVLVAALLAFGSFDSVFVFALFPLSAIARSGSMPVVADYVNRRIPSAQRATILSFKQLLFSLMLVPLLPAAGFIGGREGLPVAYTGMAIAFALVVIPVLVLWLRADRAEGEGPMVVEAVDEQETGISAAATLAD